MGEITIRGFLCERCEHKWPPRNGSEKKPFVCPKCKSPYWDTPRKNEGEIKDFSEKKREKMEYGLFPNNKRF